MTAVLAAWVLILAAGGLTVATAEKAWLIVGASDGTPGGIARAAKDGGAASASAFTFQTRDCGDKRNVFGWALDVTASAEQARAALEKARRIVKDAYIKRCDVQPRSLLAFRFPAVDPSIAGVPPDAVNWNDQDRVSSVRSLSDGRVLIIARSYVPAADDPLEGKHERVILAGPADARSVLVDSCAAASAFAERDGWVAFQCDREQAADEVLHGVEAFNPSGALAADIAHCRKPRFVAPATLACEEESVDAHGQLKLHLKTVALPVRAGAAPARP